MTVTTCTVGRPAGALEFVNMRSIYAHRVLPDVKGEVAEMDESRSGIDPAPGCVLASGSRPWVRIPPSPYPSARLLLLQMNGLAPYLEWLYRNHQGGYEVMWAHIRRLHRQYEAAMLP